ncbi:glutamine--fructose-6-phosphate transaminase (isomerizing) [Chroococcidiopsis sp. FACHB-1243]|uniref:glutamine--fructose-6-phosphate transaminase (isomerizing) n=1 Tax=Chroococcidiopsis sp. [FACHB-1243] TaxID=2692781 RepID=UPI00177D3857|nr:glutamine--fructose-6-phosphate transaminase (isomerizing) [Chroococcidiopsis sp. [FACHB-1243]]MBD2305526.1 glutamine--fructose-6-phosphate transaminase (isomerizing) [Chroococcidiopsis sp. [FACHB-1243]]
MCGIVGYIGTQAATGILLAGLEKLEYRGYDSAGIATVWEGEIHRVRAKGKLRNLQSKLNGQEIPGLVGIGHTRWATHGKPEEHNAHPHLDASKRVAVVQNGIIENYRELREELKQLNYEFVTETDTEVIPNLVAECLNQMRQSGETEKFYSPLTEAVRRVVNRLEGAFAIVLLCADYPDEIVVARQQAPLVLGFGQGEFFCASDIPAILPYTHAIVPLENGEMATLTPLGIEIYNFAGDRLKKHPHLLSGTAVTMEKQGFRHFMLKEIYEQSSVVRMVLETYIGNDWTAASTTSPINLSLPAEFYTDLEQVQIVACGTSWHASLVGKYLLEQLAQIPTQVHYASEFRYAPPPLMPNTLIVGVTQSGETADTLSAIAMDKQRRAEKTPQFRPRLLGITNRMQSSLARLVDYTIDIQAGIEIGVAATKTFIAQLVAFYCLALDLAYRRQTLSATQLEQIIGQLWQLPAQIESILEQQERQIEELAHEFTETQDFIFIGRGINYPIALEGALKLKEISYIHAEGYPAGEMKHGPIALLDAKVPVVAIAMPGSVYEKVLSNVQEAKARDSRLIGVAPMHDEHAKEIFDDTLPVPVVDEILSPILSVIPLQLLAYHIAARRGLDVDQPRNLAKSVTVE